MKGFLPISTWGKRLESTTPTLARCGLCGLAKQCVSPRMEPTGKGVRKVLFVAEAPGSTEDRRGVQLIGDAGKLLRKILRRLDKDLDDCWKTNAVICRPPKNDMQPVYIEACRPNLIRTINNLKPKVIILLGHSAVESLLLPEWGEGVGSLTKWIGWKIPLRKFGAWVCPTYHPSYLNRMDKNRVLMQLTEQHIREAFALEGQVLPLDGLEALKARIEILTSPQKVRRRLRVLSKAVGRLSFDYETTGLKPDAQGHKIKTVSFCLNGRDTFACLLDDSCLGDLSRVLRSEGLKKIGANIKFEERWTWAFLNHGVANWYWDTMQAAHILDNRSGISSLQFQAFVQFGVGDYSSHVDSYIKAPTSNARNEIDKAPVEELLLYNGLDALLTYMLMKKQKQQMFGNRI